MRIIGIVLLVIGAVALILGYLGNTYFEEPYRKGIIFLALGAFLIFRSYQKKEQSEKKVEE